MTGTRAGPRWAAPAVLSGALLALAAPPSPLPLLALVALAPWAAALTTFPPGAEGRRRAARSGALLFGVLWGIQLLWVARLALRVGWWPVLAYVAQVGMLALLGAGVGVLAHRLVRRVPLPAALALAWTAGEWVRGSALGPLDFPWMGIAVPLSAHPELIQGAAWVGERGLAAAAAASNGAVAVGLVRMGIAGDREASGGGTWAAGAAPRSRRMRAAGPLVLAAAALAFAWVAGAVRLARLEPRPVLGALAVQPAVPLELKRTEGPWAVAAAVAAAEALVPDTALSDADLVVLPETAIPVLLDASGAAGLRAEVAGWARRTGVPVAVGALGSDGGRPTNALFLAGPDPDAPWPRADKARLVPGVEWSPLADDGFARGARPALLDLPDGRRLGVLVCIESAGPEPARTLRKSGADVLVNVTNDAWLAEAPWWTRTAAFAQHPAHLRLRTVETGAGALRVANNGRTTVVDPGGRERLVLPPHAPGAALVSVASLPRATPFTSTGDVVGPACVLLSALLALFGRPRTEPAGRSAAPPVARAGDATSG